MSRLTKKQKEAVICAYENSSNTTLYDIYTRFSVAKGRAFDYCERLMRSLDGFDMRIISHNTMQFSIGFKYNDEETGALMFAYITRDYNRYFEYPTI